MTETRSLQPSAKREVPSASDFTSSPLRNRVRLELDAPVSEVWELIGDLYFFHRFAAPAQLWDDLRERFPELLNAA